MDKKQFITTTLLPYFQDPTTCGMEGGRCTYLTADGKKCAAGKWMLPEVVGTFSSIDSVRELLSTHKPSQIFLPEACAMEFSGSQWNLIQGVHDWLARRNYEAIHLERLEDLAGEPLPELREALSKLVASGYFEPLKNQ